MIYENSVLLSTPLCVSGLRNLPSAGVALLSPSSRIVLYVAISSQSDTMAALESFDQPALSASAYRLPYALDLPIHLSPALGFSYGYNSVLLHGFLRPVSSLQSIQLVVAVLFLLAGLSLTLFRYLFFAPHRFLGQTEQVGPARYYYTRTPLVVLRYAPLMVFVEGAGFEPAV